MFFGDPVPAFANIARALRPGGRLALLVWQPPDRNAWMGAFGSALAAGRPVPSPPVDAPGPFALADRDRVSRILSAAGFCDVTLDSVQAPMSFGSDTEDAFGFVRGLGFTEAMLRDLDEPRRHAALAALRATLAAHDTGQGVHYPSAAWLVRAKT